MLAIDRNGLILPRKLAVASLAATDFKFSDKEAGFGAVYCAVIGVAK